MAMAGADHITRRAALAGAITLAACGREALAPSLALGDDARVVAWPGARRLTLNDGRDLILAGLETPRPAAARAPAEPFAPETLARTKALTEDRPLRWRAAPVADRWNRPSGILEARGPDGWFSVQAALVAEGLARVRPCDEAEVDCRAWLEAEEGARAARRGLWSSPYFAVRPADAIGPSAAGAFCLVEGVILDAAAVRGWTYLNFGVDYRRDFTAAVPPDHAARFASLDLEAWPGASVRVRGFVESRNGAMITLAHPLQLERRA